MDAILRRIESHRQEMIDFATELISIPTVNPPGESYHECVETIAAKLSEIGLSCRRISVPVHIHPDFGSYPRYCLLGTLGDSGPILYMHGHYDVVPPFHDGQFEPRVNKGSLFGRGSSDMKGGLAAMVFAVQALKESGVRLNGRLALVFVPDEETGGRGGSRYLSDEGLLGKDGIGMLLPEPTSGVIWNANRGAISLRVTVRGKSAHVGMHYLGRNAFEDALTVAGALGALKKEVESRRTAFNIEPAAARRSILLMGGRMEGGTGFNVVPDCCSFTVDRRTNPEEDLETEKRRLLTLFDELKQKGIDLNVEIFQEGSSSGVSPDTRLGRLLAESIERVSGKKPKFEICPGLLETRFYAQKGIPAFAYGPGLLSVSHGPREFVKLRQLFDCASIYALTAARFLST